MDAHRPRKIVPLDARRDVQALARAQVQVQDVAALLQAAVVALNDTRVVLAHMVDAAERRRTPGAAPDELPMLAALLDRVARGASHHGRSLLDGSFTPTLALQVGPDEGHVLTFAIPPMTTDGLGLSDLADGALAGRLARAIETVGVEQAKLGMAFNRMHVILERLRSDAGPADAAGLIEHGEEAAFVQALSRAQILAQPDAALKAQAEALRGILLRFPPRGSR